MNILFLYISLPDLSVSGVFSDLIREFAKHGHNVKVATPAKPGQQIGLHQEGGIDILRFKTDQLTNNTSNIKKGLAYMKLIYQYPSAIKKYYGKEKFDVIIGHSLPPEIGLIVPQLKRYYHAKFYLQLCEYIWQDSVSLGFFKKSSPICKYYQWLERRTIKAADHIGCPSQGNVDFALGMYPWAANHDIHIIHYCQQPIEIPAGGDAIRQKLGLEGKFVAIYGGNMSIAQKVSNVLNLAESCLEYKDIVFLFLGKGQEVERIKQEAKDRKLDNIRFLAFMPQNEYQQLVATCDVGIVSLNEKLAIPNIPSKTLGLFNMAVPVLAAVDHVTDYGKYLEEAGAGLWCYSGENDKFKENLLALYNDRELCKQMGRNGFDFFMSHMTPTCGYNTIIEHIEK